LASGNKNPKVMLECLNWASSMLLEFGPIGLQVKQLLDFLKGKEKKKNVLS
jgi:hypothetical protein